MISTYVSFTVKGLRMRNLCLMCCVYSQTVIVDTVRQFNEADKVGKVQMMLELLHYDDKVRVFTNPVVMEHVALHKPYVWNMFCQVNGIDMLDNTNQNAYVDWPTVDQLHPRMRQVFEHLGDTYEKYDWFKSCIYSWGMREIIEWYPDSLERFMKFYLGIQVAFKEYEVMHTNEQVKIVKCNSLGVIESCEILHSDTNLFKSTSLLLGSMVSPELFQMLIRVH